MTWLLALAGYSLLVPLVTADKAWLHPECNKNVVEAFNEARYAADLLDKALDLEREDDLEFLDEPFEWFFGFNTEDPDHIEFVQERLKAISAIERTFVRDEANIRIYCDNMMSWKPTNANKQVPKTWQNGNVDIMNTYFKHEQEGVFAFGKNMECRHEDGDPTLAATTAFTASRNIDEGSNPIKNVIIDICQALEDDLAATSNDAVSFPLSSFQEVAEMHTIAYTIIHELIHVPSIGGGTVDGHKITSPSDTHVTSSGEVKLGYYINNEAIAGVANLPGKYLGEPHLTITNPDSYMYICMFYRFRTKGWEMQLKDNGRLVFVWNPPQSGTSEAKDWKEEDVPGGQGKRWMWSGKEWRTDQPPNWTADTTPQ